MKRHYCTLCNRKRNIDKMAIVYYKLLNKTAYHCLEHLSTNADIISIRRGAEKPVFVELFSGSGHITKAAQEKGFKTVSLDCNPKFDADISTDILKVKRNQFPAQVSAVWASIPCTYFSIMNIPDHWDKISIGYRNYLYVPTTPEALSALRILNKTISLIKQLKPLFFFIENPRGAMRHMPQMKAIPYRSTVSYYDYGFDYFKPTDIFHNCNNFKPKVASYQNAQAFNARVTDLANAYERSLIPPKLIDYSF